MKNLLFTLASITVLLLASCTKQEVLDMNQIALDLQAKDWTVDELTLLNENQTALYEGYTISFETGNVLSITDGTNSYTGTWNLSEIVSDEECDCDDDDDDDEHEGHDDNDDEGEHDDDDEEGEHEDDDDDDDENCVEINLSIDFDIASRNSTTEGLIGEWNFDNQRNNAMIFNNRDIESSKANRFSLSKK